MLNVRRGLPGEPIPPGADHPMARAHRDALAWSAKNIVRVPLTDAEKAALEACSTPRQWADVLAAIKRARHKRLPPDWHDFALLPRDGEPTGLMERVTGISIAEAHGHPKHRNHEFIAHLRGGPPVHHQTATPPERETP